MKEIFETAFAIIVSFGGAGAIVFALSSWLGKVWANRILEEEKKEHQKEIDDYKSRLSIELSRISSNNEKAVHTTKTQYDKEFEIYLEIWDKVSKCINYTSLLYPAWEDLPTDEKIKEEYIDKKWKNYISAYNDFGLTIEKYRPFYKKEFYTEFVEICNLSKRMGTIYKRYNYDVKYSQSFAFARDSTITPDESIEVYSTIPDKFKGYQEKLTTSIREYLLNLQII